MKIAFFSNISGNLLALNAILDSITKDKDIKKIVCLGDVVGKYPWPEMCIDLVLKNCFNLIGYTEGRQFNKWREGLEPRTANMRMCAKSFSVAEKSIMNYKNNADFFYCENNIFASSAIDCLDKKNICFFYPETGQPMKNSLNDNECVFFLTLNRQPKDKLIKVKLSSHWQGRYLVQIRGATEFPFQEYEFKKGKLLTFYTTVSEDKNIKEVVLEYSADKILDEVKKRNFWEESDIEYFETTYI